MFTKALKANADVQQKRINTRQLREKEKET